MLIMIVLVAIWAFLMLRSVIAEYKYYQSIKFLEPEIWAKLGSPKFFNIPIFWVSSKGSKLLEAVSNETVRELAIKHRQAGFHFVSYIAIVLVVSTVYFKTA